MKNLKLVIFLLLLSLIQNTLAQKLPILTHLGEFQDTSRDRKVPYKVYLPESLAGEYPVIIFSHGLGGSREAAKYLGTYLAERGYICFHIQHPGTDRSLWEGSKTIEEARQKLRKSLGDFKSAENRFKDLPFVLDQLEILNQQDPIFKTHLNLSQIGMMGHSYGAKSTLVAAGEKLAGRFSFKDSRIKVAIALSPNMPKNAPKDPSALFEDIDIPIFHMTGTADGDPVRRNPNFSPENRTLPYQYTHHADQYLLVFDQATHSTFGGGRGFDKNDPLLAQHLENIQKATLAFFDYYLKANENQGIWLKKEFIKNLSDKDRFEWKAAKK